VLDKTRFTPSQLSALLAAINSSHALSYLGMNACRLGHDGAAALLHLLRTMPETTRLRSIEIQTNNIDRATCMDLLAVADARGIALNVDGNPSELWNVWTHVFGVLTAVCCCVVLCGRGQRRATDAYCMSLFLVYVMSVMHHSSTGNRWSCEWTKLFFELDVSSVFMIIMGSWIPPLMITFHDRPWAMPVMVLIQVGGCSGIMICVIDDSFLNRFRMPLVIMLTYSFLALLWVMGRLYGTPHYFILAVSTVGAFTVGLFFNARHHFLFTLQDHTIWHLCVLVGNTCIFALVERYVVQRKESQAGLEFESLDQTLL